VDARYVKDNIGLTRSMFNGNDVDACHMLEHVSRVRYDTDEV
jgi:hypothetical protein